jgi:hypothetical protein
MSYFSLISALYKTKQSTAESPTFTTELTDTGVVVGHPVTLKVAVRGNPEPQLKW